VATEVTVPAADVAGSVLVMVNEPPTPGVMPMPGPAFSPTTPVLVTVTTPPTLEDTKMPGPGRMVETTGPPLPPALMVAAL
jgi:hypothetical protein